MAGNGTGMRDAGPAVECVLDARATVGEGAIWSRAAGRLYWVDIPAGRVHAFDPETGEDRHWDLGRPVGCVAETASGRLVAALTDGFHELDPHTGETRDLGGPRPGDRGHRFNDGTVDPRGRFLAGTMPLTGSSAEDDTGALHSFDGAAFREVMGGFHCVNGLAFAPDGRTAYVSDSFAEIQTIWAFDHDLDDGAWTNRRVFFDARAVAGRPDGGAMDADGCYWMAGVDGWQIVRLTPEGEVDREIAMPVGKPTRIAFGGSDLSTLYVTSIRVPDDPRQAQSGGIFALRVPGVAGVPMPVMTL